MVSVLFVNSSVPVFVAYPDKSEVIAIVEAAVLAGTVITTPLEFLKLEIVLLVSVSVEEAVMYPSDVVANVAVLLGRVNV